MTNKEVKIDPKSGHVWDDCGCNSINCAVCEGGLAVCKVCGGAEGDLTMYCPGHKLPPEVRGIVYKAGVDFIGGRWVGIAEEEVIERCRVALLEQVSAMGWPEGDFGQPGFRATHAMMTAWNWKHSAERKGAIEFACLKNGTFYDKDGCEFNTTDGNWTMVCKRPVEEVALDKAQLDLMSVPGYRWASPHGGVLELVGEGAERAAATQEAKTSLVRALEALADAVKAIAGSGIAPDAAAVAPVAPVVNTPAPAPLTPREMLNRGFSCLTLAHDAHSHVKPGQIWRHYAGAEYIVIVVTNTVATKVDDEEFKSTVVYQSTSSGKVWSRPTNQFLAKMTKVRG